MNRIEREKRYLLSLMTEEKLLQSKHSTLLESRTMWQERMKLAIEHSRNDLRLGAETQVMQIDAELKTIDQQLATAQFEIREARSKLADTELEASRILSTEETDALVQHLGQAAGTIAPDQTNVDQQESNERRQLERELETTEADLELDALRKKISKESSEH